MRSLLRCVAVFGVSLIAGHPPFTRGADLTNNVTVLVSVEGRKEVVLTLSNVWPRTKRDTSVREFWVKQGLTNSPIKLLIPGGSALCIAQGQVRPYLIREDSGEILEIPPITLSQALLKKTEISDCTTVAYSNGKLLLVDRTRKRGVFWSLWSDSDLKLHIEVTVEPGW
jgi:hypothetical protein